MLTSRWIQRFREWWKVAAYKSLLCQNIVSVRISNVSAHHFA